MYLIIIFPWTGHTTWHRPHFGGVAFALVVSHHTSVLLRSSNLQTISPFSALLVVDQLQLLAVFCISSFTWSLSGLCLKDCIHTHNLRPFVVYWVLLCLYHCTICFNPIENVVQVKPKVLAAVGQDRCIFEMAHIVIFVLLTRKFSARLFLHWDGVRCASHKWTVSLKVNLGLFPWSLSHLQVWSSRTFDITPIHSLLWSYNQCGHNHGSIAHVDTIEMVSA